MNEKITRRQALLSLAAITAGTMITTRAVSGARPVKTLLRFPVVGDFGTGGSDQIGIDENRHSRFSGQKLLSESCLPRAIWPRDDDDLLVIAHTAI